MAVRVLLLTQWFDPEPTFKGMAFARELVRQGFEVEVLTGFPNYPGGRIYPGYRVKLIQRELVDGVLVTRVPLFASHDHSAIKRVLNYTTFSVSAFIYGLFGARRPDVIYAYHPPLTVGVTAVLLRMFRGIPVVYDVQDMWPDTLRATGMVVSERVLGIVARVCAWVYRRVDRIAVQSPGFKRLLQERGVPPAKVDVIFNWADEPSLKSAKGKLPPAFPAADRFRVVFAGNIGKAQALDSLVEAASILQSRGSRITFVLVGSGVEVDGLRTKVAQRQLLNVVFLPRVPMQEIGIVLNAADALLVHLRNDPLFRVTVPSKTQAYMAVGKPLVMAVQGDAADLVRESGAGVVVESENPTALAEAAEVLAGLAPEVLAVHGMKAQAFYHEQLALQVGVTKFGCIFTTLAQAAKARA